MGEETQETPDPEVMDALELNGSRSRRRWTVTGIALLLAVVLVVWALLGRAPPPEPRTAAVDRGEVVQTVRATGTLQPVRLVTVGTEVSGVVAEVRVEADDPVQQGDLLAVLDPEPLAMQVEEARARRAQAAASLAEAQAALEEAQRVAETTARLAAADAVSQRELDAAASAAARARATARSARAQVRAADAVLASAEDSLGRTEVRAPVDGVVLRRHVEPGQAVAAAFQAPILFEIAQDLTHMELRLEVDEADVAQVLPGQEATFRVDAWPGERFEGRVRAVRLAPDIEQAVVSYPVLLEVHNPEGHLRPGMTATAEIRTAAAEDVLRVPTAALAFRPEDVDPLPGEVVWVPDPREVVRPVAVRTGLRDPRFTELVESPLLPGDRVAVGPPEVR